MNDATSLPASAETAAPLDSAPLESAMNTGTDDEPALTVGDKHVSDAPDPNGDGVLSVDEAEAILGGEPTKNAAPETATPTLEGK